MLPEAGPGHDALEIKIRLSAAGDLRIILDDDHDSEAGRVLMAAFVRDEVTPELISATGGTIARRFTSVTFGGPDVRTVDVENLHAARIPYFTRGSHSLLQIAVAGLPMVHW